MSSGIGNMGSGSGDIGSIGNDSIGIGFNVVQFRAQVFGEAGSTPNLIRPDWDTKTASLRIGISASGPLITVAGSREKKVSSNFSFSGVASS